MHQVAQFSRLEFAAAVDSKITSPGGKWWGLGGLEGRLDLNADTSLSLLMQMQSKFSPWAELIYANYSFCD